MDYNKSTKCTLHGSWASNKQGSVSDPRKSSSRYINNESLLCLLLTSQIMPDEATVPGSDMKVKPPVIR